MSPNSRVRKKPPIIVDYLDQFSIVLAMEKYTSLVVFTVLSASAWAQSGNSVIAGTVKDITGAPVPSAKILIKNVDSGVEVGALTNDAGLYRASALLPGSYRVEADASGFDHLSRGPLVLQISQTLAIDITLQVGQQNQTVNVVEAAPLVESQSSNVSQTVSRQMLNGLPLPNRAASSLAALAPGVIMIDP